VVDVVDDTRGHRPALAASEGVVYIAFSARDVDMEICINMTVNDGKGWDIWGRVNDLRTHYDPYYRLDAEKGNLVLVYMEIMETDVTFQHFNGSDWSEAEFINATSAGDQWLPQVRLVDGVAHVTYSDGGIGKHKRGSIEEGPPSSIVSRLGPYWTGAEDIALRWSMEDDFGIQDIRLEYRFSTDNDTWSDWTEFMFEDGESGTAAWGSLLFDPSDGDGFYQFRSIATDVWDKEEPIPVVEDTSVGYDTTAPTGSVSIEGGADIAGEPSVTLTLTYDDATSGVAKVRYSNEAIGGDAPWEDPTPTKEWDLVDEGGQVTVYYQVIDRAGYISQVYSDDIILDTELPTGTIEVDGGLIIVNTTLITLHLTFDDDTQVEAIRLSNDGIWDESDWGPPSGSVAWGLPEGDIGRIVYYQVKDVTGKVSQIYELNIRVDKTSPRLEAMDPADGSEDVLVNSSIRFQFSEALKPLTVKSELEIYFIDGEGRSHDLVGNITWEQDWKTFTFEPFSDLEEGTTYYVRLGLDVQDLARNELYPAVNYSFTTEGEASNGNGDGNGDDGSLLGLVVALIVIVAILVVIIGYMLMQRSDEGT
jgi:hypothetical protein